MPFKSGRHGSYFQIARAMEIKYESKSPCFRNSAVSPQDIEDPQIITEERGAPSQRTGSSKKQQIVADKSLRFDMLQDLCKNIRIH